MAVSFDGAAVMSGVKTGIQKRFCEYLDRDIPYVHCFNHQLHLAVLQVIVADNRIINSVYLCEELYIFFRKMSVCALYTGSRLPRLIANRWTEYISMLEKMHEFFLICKSLI